MFGCITRTLNCRYKRMNTNANINFTDYRLTHPERTFVSWGVNIHAFKNQQSHSLQSRAVSWPAGFLSMPCCSTYQLAGPAVATNNLLGLKKRGRTQCRELPLCAVSGEGCQWQALPSLVQCEDTATRTRDLPVTGGKTLPLAPGPPFG